MFDYEVDPAEWHNVAEELNYGSQLAAGPDMSVDICHCGEVLDDHGFCEWCEE